ncbi:hypothetical protein H0194_07005 [Corynebacterium incognita]|uniref:Uncharacterized protein n=1 Tax=Corynebacterium incognita TaxID=2754725 RepID=A0A7G7CML9_9CORY|nr:hypothetical protein [Corynebacterium incognita]QNE88835.1 hypothetical protein H0194_07005 [Corynebacterium incognita]
MTTHTQSASTSTKHQPEWPEAVRYMLLLWAGVLAGEVLHQILSTTMSFMDIEVLKAAAAKQAEESGGPMNDALATIGATGGIIVMTLLAFAILGLLAWMLNCLARKTKWAGNGRRMWFAFSIYYGIRAGLLFAAQVGASDVPDALYLLDGALQILIGVAAVMGLIFSMKQETLDYTGEMEEMRKLEEEMRQKQLEKEEAEKEKEKADKK